ncbi:MAG: hypothetical protein LBE34_10325 [Flavobacteriaceae bacterium]|nr:hypothetical protein [Flavobacteriaceae bacterium]
MIAKAFENASSDNQRPIVSGRDQKIKYAEKVGNLLKFLLMARRKLFYTLILPVISKPFIYYIYTFLHC